MKRTFLALGFLLLAALSPASAAELRIGMIGLDTSHVPAFTVPRMLIYTVAVADLD